TSTRTGCTTIEPAGAAASQALRPARPSATAGSCWMNFFGLITLKAPWSPLVYAASRASTCCFSCRAVALSPETRTAAVLCAAVLDEVCAFATVSPDTARTDAVIAAAAREVLRFIVGAPRADAHRDGTRMSDPRRFRM